MISLSAYSIKWPKKRSEVRQPEIGMSSSLSAYSIKWHKKSEDILKDYSTMRRFLLKDYHTHKPFIVREGAMGNELVSITSLMDVYEPSSLRKALTSSLCESGLEFLSDTLCNGFASPISIICKAATKVISKTMCRLTKPRGRENFLTYSTLF